MAYCPYCTQGLPPDSDWCPHCQRSVSGDVLKAPVPEAAPRVASKSEAVYSADEPMSCPHCRKSIQSVHVVRLARTQVPFTSALPRSGRALICPSCARILSVELAGLP